MKAAAFLLIFLGILDSGYLLYSDLQPYCPLEACETPLIPLLPSYSPALFGLLWFISAIPLFFWKEKLEDKLVFAFWRYTGITGVAFLATYSLLNLYFCPYCIAAYSIGALLIFLSAR
jgi:hypothetical protein